MKPTFIALLTFSLCVPLVAADKKLIADPIVEKAIRKTVQKFKGELIKADLEKVTKLYLTGTKITDAGLKELAKCKQLRELYPRFSKVTKAGIAQLQKALPKCKVDWP